jgi:glucokinase
LQALVSGPALMKQSIEKGLDKEFSGKTADLADITDLAYKNNIIAQGIFIQAGERIGRMIVNMVMLLDLPLIILGGGVIGAGNILINSIWKTIEDLLSPLKRKIEIKISQLGDINGVIGALSLIYFKINNNQLFYKITRINTNKI